MVGLNNTINRIRGFPKIGDPNIVPYNSRALIIRSPKSGTGIFGKLH